MDDLADPVSIQASTDQGCNLIREEAKTSGDEQTGLVDLILALRHGARDRGLDWDAALDSALGTHYPNEVSD